MATENQNNDDTYIDETGIERFRSSGIRTLADFIGQKQGSAATSSSDPFSTNIRRENPLAKFSSYTYNITLYMLTPVAMNFYVNTGRLPPSGGKSSWFIVAQSAGLSNSDPRMIPLDPNQTPGSGIQGLDYYIDDLQFETHMLGSKDRGLSTLSTEFQFKIVEPTGFFFLTRMKRASDTINRIAEFQNSQSMPNLYQQNYIIGIKFYGYDQNGNLVTNNQENVGTKTIEDKYAYFERLFPIKITESKFKIGTGTGTTYDFSASLMANQAASLKKWNVVPSDKTISGSTVGEILGAATGQSNAIPTTSLMAVLNNTQQDYVSTKQAQAATKYSIEFIDNGRYRGEEIKNSAAKNSSVIDSSSTSTSVAQTTEQSNAATAAKSNTIDKGKFSIPIKGGSSVLQVIDTIISSSMYVDNFMTTKTNSDPAAEGISNDVAGQAKWWTIRPVVNVGVWDSKLNDWTYDIKYIVQPYPIPYAPNPNVVNRLPYYGPIKQYDYLFTGNNTEVISFEQSYNSLFYIIQTPEVNTDTSKQTNDGKPRALAAQNVSTNQTGKNSVSNSNNSLRAIITSPGDQAEAQIRVLGDPDFLMSAVGYQIASRGRGNNSFVGESDMSINPYGGQLFVEIVFKTAEDYDSNTGLVHLTDEQVVDFYTPEDRQRIGATGVVYRLNKVLSSFSRGKFEQTLEMVMVEPKSLVGKGEVGSDAGRQQTVGAGISAGLVSDFSTSNRVLGDILSTSDLQNTTSFVDSVIQTVNGIRLPSLLDYSQSPAPTPSGVSVYQSTGATNTLVTNTSGRVPSQSYLRPVTEATRSIPTQTGASVSDDDSSVWIAPTVGLQATALTQSSLGGRETRGGIPIGAQSGTAEVLNSRVTTANEESDVTVGGGNPFTRNTNIRES